MYVLYITKNLKLWQFTSQINIIIQLGIQQFHIRHTPLDALAFTTCHIFKIIILPRIYLKRATYPCVSLFVQLCIEKQPPWNVLYYSRFLFGEGIFSRIRRYRKCVNNSRRHCSILISIYKTLINHYISIASFIVRSAIHRASLHSLSIVTQSNQSHYNLRSLQSENSE